MKHHIHAGTIRARPWSETLFLLRSTIGIPSSPEPILLLSIWLPIVTGKSAYFVLELKESLHSQFFLVLLDCIPSLSLMALCDSSDWKIFMTTFIDLWELLLWSRWFHASVHYRIGKDRSIHARIREAGRQAARSFHRQCWGSSGLDQGYWILHRKFTRLPGLLSNMYVLGDLL